MNVCPRCGCPSLGLRCRRCMSLALPITGNNGNGTGDLGFSIGSVVKKVKDTVKKAGESIKKAASKTGSVSKSILPMLTGGGMPPAAAQNIAADLEARGLSPKNAKAAAEAALKKYKDKLEAAKKKAKAAAKADKATSKATAPSGFKKALPYILAGTAAVAVIGLVAATTRIRSNKRRRTGPSSVVER